LLILAIIYLVASDLPAAAADSIEQHILTKGFHQIGNRSRLIFW
jgi:hypothetical protein